jgi:hypothetical protein
MFPWDVKECQTPSRSLVAATFEKAITYVFAATAIRDREVGGLRFCRVGNSLAH